ncbi:polymeric immunoglobulin receptor isoform X2 [Lepus europaeus]|uniref:polymeric immunoglobulin receptor isoform X2 n=1 Tax=Lepus europaeus TaxID=9983 RepID=UPI002B47CEC8|nr:polymeric immunoglobulin receptor isoform X2 [Lepus europaeus]
MALFLLTCLLAVFSAATAQNSLLGPSSIFGPEEVNALEGDSVSITCYYPTTSVNRHSRKFWCREEESGRCVTLVSTGYTSQEYSGRGTLTDFPNKGEFVVNINGLSQDDSGSYKCGVGVNGRGLDFGVNVLVSQKIVVSPVPTVLKGFPGGSVTIRCPYNPKKDDSLMQLYLWEGSQTRHLLVDSGEGLVQKDYRGRLALFKEPGNGTFSVILNQLAAEDKGFYWCVSDNDSPWTTSVELQIVDGDPSPTIDKFSAEPGKPVEISCHFPCKYFSSEKYWCKWNEHGCEDLPAKLSSSDDIVKCNNNLVLTLTLDSVSKDDEGWYWCGAKDGDEYKEVAAVRVELTDPAKVAVNPPKAAVDPAKVAVNPVKAAPAPAEKAKAVVPSAQEKAVVPVVKEAENKVVQKPRLFAEDVAVQSAEDPASGSRASVDTGSASGQSGSAKVLISTLVPLGLVLAVGAMAVAIARARHRRNVDRVSIGSYRTDISMSDLENSREFGAIDNPSACPDARETALGGKDELATAAESTVEIEEPKKAKRSSKEEADLAYSAFLLQSNTIAAEHQDGPKEA